MSFSKATAIFEYKKKNYEMEKRNWPTGPSLAQEKLVVAGGKLCQLGLAKKVARHNMELAAPNNIAMAPGYCSCHTWFLHQNEVLIVSMTQDQVFHTYTQKCSQITQDHILLFLNLYFFTNINIKCDTYFFKHINYANIKIKVIWWDMYEIMFFY
jgi:hypothetical protein